MGECLSKEVFAILIHKRRLLSAILCFVFLSSLIALPAPAAAANAKGPLLSAWLAASLEGAPYSPGGTNPDVGFDNVGFVAYVFRQMGAEVPRSLASLASMGSTVSKAALQAGDLVFFKGPNNKNIIHVGVYLDKGDFVASSSSTGGVVRRNLSQAYYVEHFVTARRIPSTIFRSAYEALGRVARDAVGLPYLKGGASARGVDNTGLMGYIYGCFFLSAPESLSALAQVGVSVNRSSLRAGDMVFFHDGKTKEPYRVGLSTGDGLFIVVDAELGRVVERSLTQSFYSSRFLFARRPLANYQEPAAFASQGVPTSRPSAPSGESTVAVADRLIALAGAQIGKKYVLGATGPVSFDCSGLTYYVFKEFGYKLPRASYNQATVGSLVQRQNLIKGDLVFFRNTWRGNGSVDHVAIYIGDGKILHAITGGVTTSSLSGYWLDHYAGARRILK